METETNSDSNTQNKVTAEIAKTPTFNHSKRQGCRPLNVICNYKRIKIDSNNNIKVRLYAIKMLPEIPPNSKLIYSIMRNKRQELSKIFKIHFQQGLVIYSTEEVQETIEFETLCTQNNINYFISIVPTKATLGYIDTETDKDTQYMKIKQFLEKVVNSILNANSNLIRFNKKNVFDCGLLRSLGESKIIPGFNTSISVGEMGPMIRITTKNKLINSTTCFEKMRDFKTNEEIKEYFLGKSVLTGYGAPRIYKIDDVTFSDTVNSVNFNVKMKDNTYEQLNLFEYYKRFYDKIIKETNQPLFIMLRDKNGTQEKIFLVPELCLTTGIDEKVKQEESFNKNLSKTRMRPTDRMAQVNKFLEYFNSKDKKNSKSPYEIKNEWGIDIDTSFVTVKARELPTPKITFKGKDVNVMKGKFRSEACIDGETIKKWGYICERNDDSVKGILENMKKASQKLEFLLIRPECFELGSSRNWAEELYKRREAFQELTIVVVMLPNNNAAIYKSVKNIFLTKIKVPVQCLLIQKQRGTNLSSITGVLNQMIVKTKGSLYNISLGSYCQELQKPSCIIGIEISKVGKSVKYTFCSTINRFHNIILSESYLKNPEDNNFHPINEFIRKLISEFSRKPETFIFYRNGVNRYENKAVINDEVIPLKTYFISLNIEDASYKPKFTYIVTNKIVDTKFFENGGNNLENPSSGMCVDTLVTTPGSYEFYIQPQFVNMGTATPTKFTVLYDSSTITMEDLEQITYNMCYYYWNWSGAIRVPAILKFSELCAKFNQLNLGEHIPGDNIKRTPYFI